MSIRNLRTNKEEVYAMAFTLSKLFMIFSMSMFSIYLIAPLLGGKLSFSALIRFGSWIILSIGIRIVSQQGRKGLRIRLIEWSFLWLVSIINLIVWFTYPINIILGILSVIAMIVSYRAQKRRMRG